MSSLHASAHSIIDGALANDDVRNVDGIVARLSTFVELSVIKSVPMVNDEVVGIMNALALVREHPYGASPRADDLVLRALVAKGVAHKTKTEIHVNAARKPSASARLVSATLRVAKRGSSCAHARCPGTLVRGRRQRALGHVRCVRGCVLASSLGVD